MKCTITQEVIKDPVVTNCGHIFERQAIERWANEPRPGEQGALCPCCRTSISVISSIPVLRETIETWNQKDPIPTCAHFKEGNPLRAEAHLVTARNLRENKDLEGALEAYETVFKYTNSSEIYQEIPSLYEELHELDKAQFARLHLWLYQIQERKNHEAIATFKQLFSQLKDPIEKRIALLAMADLACAAGVDETGARLYEGAFRSIGRIEWARASEVQLPPYPLALQEFLNGDCTIWPGKKRHETHIVVPLFSSIDRDGETVPFTLASLEILEQNSGGLRYAYCPDSIYEIVSSPSRRHWAVMTKGVIPGTLNQSYEDQKKLLPEGYQAPGILDAARALLWEYRCTGTRHFENRPSLFTHCKEIEGQVYVGAFDSDGLRIGSFNGNRDCLGLAGWREF